MLCFMPSNFLYALELRTFFLYYEYSNFSDKNFENLSVCAVIDIFLRNCMDQSNIEL